MNIVAIIGSPHGMNGNTGRLLEEVLAGASEEGGQVDIVSLSGFTVLPCNACDVCHRVGTCPLKDDFEEIRKKLLVCDGFVFASPNYIFSVSAQMKALFDRCGSLIHLMALEGKYGVAVETSGGGEDAVVLRYMEQVIAVLGALTVGSIGSPMIGVRQFPEEEILFAQARELGRELCRSVREKRQFPGQDAFQEAFRKRMGMLMEYRKGEWTFEYDYWQKQGKA